MCRIQHKYVLFADLLLAQGLLGSPHKAEAHAVVAITGPPRVATGGAQTGRIAAPATATHGANRSRCRTLWIFATFKRLTIPIMNPFPHVAVKIVKFFTIDHERF